ncbi:fibrocystin-L-like [Ylistrum balloti]|uniref:fibrocystin-L-like n=1 Tax=Ylistrum balloti TaxID=509963 RepID=UPI002905CB9A|nr:fibrocystin-L-like [Ylistrum balloti]
MAELPPCSAGSHHVKVIAGSHGAGLNSKNQLPSITCNLELNSIKPLGGSLFGGTSLTLEGRGFTSDTKVKVGSYDCDVTAANISLVICRIERTQTIHRVNNHGYHPSFGKYYYWNPQHIKVKVGDVVRWDWDFPFYITKMKPRVEETYNMTAKSGKPGGFSNGDVGTSTGWYSHEFGRAGLFYYWSGVIDEYGTTWFHGSVEVIDRASFLADVTVTHKGFEAKYNLAKTLPTADTTKCCDASVHRENCSDPFPFDSSDTTKFKFAFWTCRSPVVNQISRQNGTTNDQIRLSGNGFSEISGSNNITFGDYICKVSSSSLTSITCTIGSENKPRIGRPQYLVFYVNNVGYAHVNINTDILKTFALFPVVDNISPKNGSRGGYTHLTISGTGFEEGKGNVSTEVNIGGYPCDIVSSSYTEIICLTPRSSVGNRNVSVIIPVTRNKKIPAVCAASCQFLYDDQMTPTVTNVTPKTITGENTTSVTITGTGFGEDKTKVSVNMRSSEIHKCLVESVSNSKITCLIKSLPLGQNEVVVDIISKGRATNKGNVNITSTATILDIIPKQGSVHGGTDVTIIGNGFLSDVSVEVDGFQYSVKYRTVMSLVFTTREHTAGMAVLNIQSNGVKYPERNFNFTEKISPTVSAVYPSSGTYGQNITITGYNLGTRLNETSVFIGDSNCTVTAVNQTDLKCTVGVQRAGTYNMHVSVYGVGNSNADETFTFNMSVNAIKPRSGSLAGDQRVTVLGSGFDSDMVVTICGSMCNMSKSQLADPTQFICDTPSSSDLALQQCDVKIIVNSVTETLENAYTYDPALTPVIDDVTPKRGGTQGGTKLTISGSNFGLSQVTTAGCVSKVTIGGTLCNITKWTNSSIECVTEAHSKSERAGVRLETGCNGKANEENARFHFVDVWSSVYTWGGAAAGLPTAGDIVVIQKGQTILFDTDSPILKMLIIQGGELVFDEVDVELHAENILITDGGLLQVGTEDNPFEHRATISLHGHQRSKELPIYGTKSLAVREGTLDLHGLHRDITWTKLAHTAEAGDKHLNLQHEVTWQKGDLIVISTTGGVNSQTETEVVTIESVSSDNKTITLGSELANSHLGRSELVAGRRLDFSAEVGLLTRNVVVRGQSDPQWKENIKPCPDGLDPGNLAVQTCNRGRSGGEMGSDQFGAQVIIHTTDPKKQVTRSRIEYVEFYHVGQAFRLGRHPINFYKTGDMSKSYVRGCGIHDTFNRAINIRDTHNLLIERNVIYNVNGVAIFLEDGTETGNVFQYNLGIDVKGSSQLLNSDISPATFWITNPNNTLRHNVAAGGTHFGYWFRLEDSVRSDVTGSYRPQYTPITEFNNNTAHSLGWYGLWIYPKYTPHVMYSYSSTVKAAVIEDMYVWNCRKGIEVNEMGAVHVLGLTAVNNVDAGYEGKIIYEGNLYNDYSPFLKDSMIVGYLSGIPPQECTNGGVVLPYKFGFSIHNVSFVNFNQSNSSALRITRIPKRCSYNCGGYTYRTDNLTFINADHRIYNEWIWESVYEDMDGSLCGSPSCKVVPCTGTLPPKCTFFSNYSNIPLCNCPADVRLIRFAPYSQSYASSSWNLVLTNKYGSTPHHYRYRAIYPSSGWMTNLIAGSSYVWEFDDGYMLTNFSYYGYFYRMQFGDYVIISQALTGEPDEVHIDGYSLIPATNETLDPETHYHGDWQYNETSGFITYLVSYRRRGHTDGYDYGTQDISVYFSVRKCFFKGCITPTLAPSTYETSSPGTPAYIYWSSPTSWPNSSLPVDGDDVIITEDDWMVADTVIPRLNKLIIYGVLEFDISPVNNSYRNFTLSVTDIIIIGGRLLIGSPNNPFLGQIDIVLRGRRLGDLDTEDYLPFTQIPVNAKTIAVYGGLEINGKDIGVPWTRLAETGNPGESSITLADNVTWRVGTEIVIGPTSYDMWETEIFRITHVSEDGLTLTLNSSLQFRHIAHKETINGRRINIAAEVGLLTRNIRIYGEDTEPMHHESYGGRILVGATLFNHQLVKGYARFSNVEFIHTGQGKWKSYIKREYSLTYSNAETVTEDKPSSVTKCAFHHGFSSAIDVSGTTGLVLSDNVIHHSVSVAIETQSLKTTLQRNLIVLVRVEDSYPGAISGMLSSKLTFINNTVSGTDGVAFNVPGVKCGLSSGPSGNEAHSSSIGLAVFPGNKGHERCNEISNYFIWKCSNMGIYYNNMQSVNIAGNVLAENNIGIYTEVIGPSPVDHLYTWKSCTVKDSLIIGTTSSYNCTTDRAKSSGIINQVDGGHVGMTFASFLGGSNWNPFYGLTRIETYPAIMGVTNIQGVTFAHFKSVCGAKDVMLTTNKWNDDGQHPVVTSKIMKFSSDNDSYFFIHRPNIDKINPRDCVDMDCDGLKKALIKDEDGSFLGEKGAVISQSEWEWDGDPRRGLGDYRIPKEMLTTLNGERINVSTIAPHKGIIRNDHCHYRPVWQAYECHDLDYEMLIIESLDADTETRRLSPVAILGDGYLDLINGPQDHSDCSQGYCRKRLSTFMAIVASGNKYSVFFSTTSPQTLRLFLLNSNDSQAVTLKIWYSQSNRRDVYVGEDLVLAKNARMVNEKYIVDRPSVPGEFVPDEKSNDRTGTNFFDRNSNVLYVLLRGSSPVKIVTNPSFIVSFQIPALTPEEFYGEALVHNLALFFDVPPEKIRVVNVVRESGRRKRDADGYKNVVFEISNNPIESANTTANASIPNESLTTEKLLNLSSKFINEVQGGGDIGKMLNLTVRRIAVSEPVVDHGLDAPRLDSAGEINVPKRINISKHIASSYETAPFPKQPCLRVFDVQDEPMSKLGSIADPWRITAHLVSAVHTSAQLHGTTTVNVISGWANFTDLKLSQFGDGFIIHFNKTYPENEVNLDVISESFDVDKIVVSLRARISTDLSVVNNITKFRVDLLDNATQQRINNITWRGHTWTAMVNLSNALDTTGNMTGLKHTNFNHSTGEAIFNDLAFDQIGIYFLRFHVQSSPEEYDVYGDLRVEVLNEAQISLLNDDTSVTTKISLTFNESFDDVVGEQEEEFGDMVVNRLTENFTGVYFDNVTVKRGCIVVDSDLVSTSNNTNDITQSLAEVVEKTQFKYKGKRMKKPEVIKDGKVVKTKGNDATPSTSSSSTTVSDKATTVTTASPSGTDKTATETTASPSGTDKTATETTASRSGTDKTATETTASRSGTDKTATETTASPSGSDKTATVSTASYSQPKGNNGPSSTSSSSTTVSDKATTVTTASPSGTDKTATETTASPSGTDKTATETTASRSGTDKTATETTASPSGSDKTATVSTASYSQPKGNNGPSSTSSSSTTVSDKATTVTTASPSGTDKTATETTASPSGTDKTATETTASRSGTDKTATETTASPSGSDKTATVSTASYSQPKGNNGPSSTSSSSTTVSDKATTVTTASPSGTDKTATETTASPSGTDKTATETTASRSGTDKIATETTASPSGSDKTATVSTASYSQPKGNNGPSSTSSSSTTVSDKATTVTTASPSGTDKTATETTASPSGTDKTATETTASRSGTDKTATKLRQRHRLQGVTKLLRCQRHRIQMHFYLNYQQPKGNNGPSSTSSSSTTVSDKATTVTTASPSGTDKTATETTASPSGTDKTATETTASRSGTDKTATETTASPSGSDKTATVSTASYSQPKGNNGPSSTSSSSTTVSDKATTVTTASPSGTDKTATETTASPSGTDKTATETTASRSGTDKTATETTASPSGSDKTATVSTASYSKTKGNDATPSTSSSSTTVNNKTATYTTTASSTSDKAATYTTTASPTSDKAATYTTTASSTSDKAATYTTTASPTSDKAATYTTTASPTSDKAATYTTTASPTSDKAATYTTTASPTSDKAATYTTTASSTSDKAATYTTTASSTSDKAATYTTTSSSTSDKAATETTSSPEKHLTKTSVGSDDCTTRTGENNWRRYESLTHVESGNEMKPRQLIPRLQTTGDMRTSTPTFESENQMPSSMAISGAVTFEITKFEMFEKSKLNTKKQCS